MLAENKKYAEESVNAAYTSMVTFKDEQFKKADETYQSGLKSMKTMKDNVTNSVTQTYENAVKTTTDTYNDGIKRMATSIKGA